MVLKELQSELINEGNEYLKSYGFRDFVYLANKRTGSGWIYIRNCGKWKSEVCEIFHVKSMISAQLAKNGSRSSSINLETLRSFSESTNEILHEETNLTLEREWGILKRNINEVIFGNNNGNIKKFLELKCPAVFSIQLAQEVPDDKSFWEGAVKRIQVNAFERDPRARQECLNHFGYDCQVCSFDFEKSYGEIGRRFIHVHHRFPLSKVRKGYKVDPEKHLVPVCPNCHEMLHKKDPPYEVDELKEIIMTNLKSKVKGA
jgi:predicted HNH restriction endonuclease